MLPLSQTSPDKAAAKPAMFADTGVPLLFQGMFELGCCKEALVVKVVGGGNLHDTEGIFNIGERNVTFIRKLMRKNGIPIAAEDVGGQKSRTVRLYAAGGRVTVSSLELEMEL
jgi:chemotaxis protein CheD